jgi:hypothetical protein
MPQNRVSDTITHVTLNAINGVVIGWLNQLFQACFLACCEGPCLVAVKGKLPYFMILLFWMWYE